jgi:hypothetical protein
MRRARNAPKDQIQGQTEIAAAIKDETAKAWKVSDGITTTWLPKTIARPNFKRGTIIMPAWLAAARGFIQ